MNKNNNDQLINLSNIINMTTFTITEKYDIVNAKKLLMSNIIDEEYKASLQKYFKHGKNGKVEIEYKVNDIGRLNIKVKDLKEGETCLAQSFMKSVCKSAICKKYYNDLDIVNAHPVFILQIFQKLNYECSILNQYVNDRDSIFKYCQHTYNLSRDNVKTLIMRIFYGGSIDSFCKEYKINKSLLPELLIHLENEMKKNTENLLNRNDMIKYKMKAIETKGDNYYNINGTAMSYYAQTIECNCLLTIYEYLKSKDIKVGALIHDGLHIDNEYTEIEELIKELEIILLQKTGFNLNLKIKPFQEINELEEMIVISTDKEGGDYISDKLKNDYLISHERIFMRINNVWTENPKVIQRNLIKIIGNMNIFMEKERFNKDGDRLIDLIPHSTMKKGCMDMLNYVEPTEDEDFIENLWKSNLFKICFKNGYYDFKKSKLQKYDIDTHTTIKINRDYVEPNEEYIRQVYEKIFNPIFNNDKELMDCWLNYIARGLAGHIEDKNWGIGIGERDCGKGVLVGLLENCFGDYCRSTNSENFLFKKGQADTAKALSWLVPFEFRRLLLTNEITIDSEGKYRINGNILKKLSSGGDKIEARVNHKDEINFKIQARVCMFCNDLPPIEPADTKETSYMFRFPSKFLNPDDNRLGKAIMRPIMKQVNEEIEYEYDEEGNKKMINVCNFYKKDDLIKQWCQKEEVMNAFIYIIFNNYGNKALIPHNMKEDMNDFKEEEKEEDIFYSLFNFVGDESWNDKKQDWVSIDQIKYLLQKSHISLSPQKYKTYLLSKGCMKIRKTINNKKIQVWINIQINQDKAREFNINNDYDSESDSDED